MLWQIALYCALYMNASSTGQDATSMLRRDEAKWASRLGLTPSYVDKIIKAAGYSEEDEFRIENLDVGHLSQRKHILLVTAAGNGHCLTLSVVARKAESLQKIWELSETPAGGGFCHVGAYSGNFRAYATSTGKIVIDVPKDKRGRYILDAPRLVYKWDGEHYSLRTD